MINRKLEKELDAWSRNPNRKPLIIRGARQVGKTTLVRKFASKFAVFLQLNLELADDFVIFERTDNVHQALDAIYLHNRKTKQEESTLLFIDEIQQSAKAVAMLRYFYEEYPELHVVVASSLLETLLDKRQISFPVGRVEFLSLRPCNFLEFLDGMNEHFDANLIVEMAATPVHERVMKLFNAYTIIGGMPAAIMQYAQKRDILSVSPVYESLLVSYREDAEKYASTDTVLRAIRHILDVGWRYAGDVVAFERFGGSAFKSREMGEAFRTIEKALLLELVYSTSETRLPVLPNLRRKPKLVWLDTGLVNYVAGIQTELFTASDIIDTWRGRIAEHIAAQELIGLTDRVSAQRFFWRRDKAGSEAEVDFVFPFNGKLIPIEVKSGHNAHLRSLHRFMEAAPHNVAIRVWSQPYSVDSATTPRGKVFTIINLPFYYLCVLPHILQENGV
ncbi:MAG: AAA family ATPase [Bacteroidia bacterium]|nr:AAA family ATPase [Bacteroidia bacterium]